MKGRGKSQRSLAEWVQSRLALESDDEGVEWNDLGFAACEFGLISPFLDEGLCDRAWSVAVETLWQIRVDVLRSEGSTLCKRKGADGERDVVGGREVTA
jgi:hypothetical protein